VGAGPLEQGERRTPVGGDLRLVAFASQQERERLGERGLVFDDEDAGHVAAPSVVWGATRGPSGPRTASGRRMVKVDPLPGWDHTRTSPPWFCTMCLTIARPSPVPPVLRLRAES